jgi:hypothetical protein
VIELAIDLGRRLRRELRRGSSRGAAHIPTPVRNSVVGTSAGALNS